MKALGVIVPLFACIVLSCGSQGTQTSHVGVKDGSDLLQIIGDNDLRPIDRRYERNPVIRSIGRMNLGCTATHVGGGIAITAGHCFAHERFEGRRGGISCSDRRHETTWGLTYGSNGYLTSSCKEVIATEYNRWRDYAIFRVYPIPDSSVVVSSNPVGLGTRISIYSYPRRRHMEWSGYCKIDSYSPKSENQFLYECDTEPGSSGAAVLNDRMEVVGIHDYYSDDAGQNGGTFVTSTSLPDILHSHKIHLAAR